MSNNVDLLAKLKALGLLDKVEALVRDAEEEEEEKKVRGKLVSVISESLKDLGITDGNGILKSWPFPGKAIVVKLWDNGDSGVVIDVRRESLSSSKRRGKKNGKGVKATSPEGEIWVGPNYAEICRAKGIDFSGRSSTNALRSLGWTLEEMDEEVEEVKRIS